MSSSFNKGFTLMEMMVVVAIVVIISTVTLLNFPRFSASQQLQLAAQDVLTTVRETQLYGIAVRGESATTPSGIETVYKSQGIFIDPDFLGTGPADPEAGSYFMVYIDADHVIGSTDGNEGFNDNQTTCTANHLNGPCIVKLISAPIRATQICVSYDGTTERCSDDATAPITAIDILFQRPEPEPKIWAFDENGNRISANANYVKVTLEALTDNGTAINIGDKVISAYNTGQISIIGEDSARPQRGGK